MLKHNSDGDGGWWFPGVTPCFGDGDRVGNGHSGGFGDGYFCGTGLGDGFGRGYGENPSITSLIIDEDPVTMAYQSVTLQTTGNRHAQ